VCRERLKISPELSIGDIVINSSNVDESVDGIELDDENFRNELEELNIFFSYPLDFDYLMIESFLEKYKDKKGRGPNILKHKDESNYEELLVEYVKTPFEENFTLNDSVFSGKGELLAWHKYLFTNKKPLIHYLFLSDITDDELLQNLPPIFNRIIQKINSILGV